MTARQSSEPFAPTVRVEGPPGVDWTQTAPECPACWRAWLAGDLRNGPLLSRRTYTALAAATLALSSTAPTAVLAAGHRPHRSHANLRDSDPGAPGVDLPIEDSPSAPAAPEPDPPDVDPEGPDPGTSEAPQPVAGQSGPADPDDSGSNPEPPAASDESRAPQAPDPPPVDATPVAPQADPPSAAIAGPPNQGAPHGLRTQRHIAIKSASGRSHRSHKLRQRQTTVSTTRQTPTRPIALSAGTAVPRTARARPGDRLHIVRPGESLWSIATDLLGGRASSARIAAEVQRLWLVNRERIGSGDPNLLPTGTRLIMR